MSGLCAKIWERMVGSPAKHNRHHRLRLSRAWRPAIGFWKTVSQIKSWAFQVSPFISRCFNASKSSTARPLEKNTRKFPFDHNAPSQPQVHSMPSLHQSTSGWNMKKIWNPSLISGNFCEANSLPPSFNLIHLGPWRSQTVLMQQEHLHTERLWEHVQSRSSVNFPSLISWALRKSWFLHTCASGSDCKPQKSLLSPSVFSRNARRPSVTPQRLASSRTTCGAAWQQLSLWVKSCRSFKKKGKRLSRNESSQKKNGTTKSFWIWWKLRCFPEVFDVLDALGGLRESAPFPPLGTARGRLTTGSFSSQMLQVANWVDSARWRSWDVQDQQVMQKTGTERFPILEEKASQLKLKTKVSCDAVPNSRYFSLSAPCDQLAASRYVSSQSKHIFRHFSSCFHFRSFSIQVPTFLAFHYLYTHRLWHYDCSIKSHESCLANDCDMRCIWYGVNCVELCELLSFEAAGYVPFKVLLPLAQICGIFGLPKIKTHQKISSDSEITSKNTISIGFMYIHIVLWIGDPWVSISTCNAIWSFPASRHHSQTLVPLADRVWVPNCSVTHRQGNTRIFYHIEV